MRLLITLDFPPERGGIQRHLGGIVAHTFGKDDVVLVGCSRVPRVQRKAPPDFPCTVTYVTFVFSPWNKKWSLIPLLFRCVWLRLRQGPSLSLECGNVYAAVVPWLVSFVLPVRYCLYAHGTEINGMKTRTPASAVLRSVSRRACRIIANSLYTSSLVNDMFSNAKIDVVSPKIELVPPLSQISRTSEGDIGTLHILCVARLVAHKGLDVLLEALAMLPKATAWELVIAGQGPLLDRLREQSNTLGTGRRVRFKTGLSDTELEQEYHWASLFVLPSIPKHGVEGFGIVLLEAMAHRIPIIASATGGIPEVLAKGECGVLVPPGDPRALSDAILRIASDATLRNRLVSKGYERLLNHYVWR